jgi:hypothetical protein
MGHASPFQTFTFQELFNDVGNVMKMTIVILVKMFITITLNDHYGQNVPNGQNDLSCNHYHCEDFVGNKKNARINDRS